MASECYGNAIRGRHVLGVDMMKRLLRVPDVMDYADAIEYVQQVRGDTDG